MLLNAAICLVLLPGMLGAVDFVVAVDGDDANAGTLEAPFATVGRAQAAVRDRIGQGLDKNITVYIRAGAYRLDAPLVFGPGDSGTADHRIVYAAYPGERPVLSGGRAITGWQAAANGQWTVEIPEAKNGAWKFRDLYAGDTRLPRGRYPDSDLLRVIKVNPEVTRIELNRAGPGGDLAGKNTELVVYQNWSISRVLVASSNDRTLTMTNPVGWIGHGDYTTVSPGKPAYLENALEFVDQPGEWYLDYDSGVLTYQAAEGEDPKQKDFIAPYLEEWLRVEGRADAPVRNLHFEGLDFKHAAWELPSFGYLGIQAGHHGTRMDAPTHVLPVAILFEYAQDCSITNASLRHTGASGIGIGTAGARNRIAHCTLEDIGGNGIMCGWRGRMAQDGKTGDFSLAADWPDPAQVPEGNVIEDNTLRRCGAVNHGSVAIFDAFCRDTRIAYNLVHDMPYTGISIGFEWSEIPTSQRGCIVENNHVYDVMKLLADGGAIYTLGWQPGTVLRGNHLHDVHRSAFAHGGAPNNGVFFDQGTKGLHVEKNVIYKTSGESIRFNQTSEANLTWKDNHFGLEPDDPAFPKDIVRNAVPRMK